MKQLLGIFTTLLLIPSIAFAQNVQTVFINVSAFLGDIVIPSLFAIAFVFFIINVVRFFIAGATNQEGRDRAKRFATYSVLAFVFLIIFWGIINTLTNFIFGGTIVQDVNDIQSDYVNKSP